ncbi:FhaA domain-containing protein [Oryzobacter sp. R7]|uniref:FhaA domain-containing protein n=1 Tax=Oryzobacter faecalis TaxID=3388656 RepID=UPI00398D523A
MGLFDRLEAGLERAVQGTFAKHLRSAVHPVEIASNIRRAMDDRAVTSSGRAIVPNVFTIELSPGDYDRLHPDLQHVEMDLVAAAEEHCDGQRYTPAGPIDIVFEEHDDLETGVFRIRPSKASRPRATGMTGQHQAVRPRHRPAERDAPPVRDGRPEATPGAAAAGAAAAAAAAGPPPARDDVDATARHPQPPRPAVRRPNAAERPWLDVDGERYPLMGAITILGRDDAADIILDDPGISRRHSELRVTTDGPHTVTTIRDLGSTNGTFVNGERITSEHLDDGDRVTVGRTSITFRAGKR